jgi:hypothetical protein
MLASYYIFNEKGNKGSQMGHTKKKRKKKKKKIVKMTNCLMCQPITIKPILFQVKRVTGAVNPYVAIHIRRTDKISEASFHQVEEYMKYVEEYFLVSGD